MDIDNNAFERNLSNKAFAKFISSPALKKRSEGYPEHFNDQVPKIIRVLKYVQSDIPFKEINRHPREVSFAWTNSWGAVSAVWLNNTGFIDELGLTPDEFEVLEWADKDDFKLANFDDHNKELVLQVKQAMEDKELTESTCTPVSLRFWFTDDAIFKAVDHKTGESQEIKLSVRKIDSEYVIQSKLKFQSFKNILFCSYTRLHDIKGGLLFAGDVVLTPGGTLYFIHKKEQSEFILESMANLHLSRDYKGFKPGGSVHLDETEAKRMLFIGNVWEPLEILEARAKEFRGNW